MASVVAAGIINYYFTQFGDLRNSKEAIKFEVNLRIIRLCSERMHLVPIACPYEKKLRSNKYNRSTSADTRLHIDREIYVEISKCMQMTPKARKPRLDVVSEAVDLQRP